MGIADSQGRSRLLRFRSRSEATVAATEGSDERGQPTDVRELKPITNRIIILAVLGLVALLLSWYAG
jgi:hypothetical protein